MRDADGRKRVIVRGVTPEIDCGRFPIKRTVGEKVVVEADAFTDGHDLVACVLQYRAEGSSDWQEMPMQPIGNDRWRGEFTVRKLGRYHYTVQAWVDHFATWRHDLQKRLEAGQDVALELRIGAQIIRDAATRAPAGDTEWLRRVADTLERSDGSEDRIALALRDELARMMRYPERQLVTSYVRELAVVVDRERARYSTWYEMFPRSCSPEAGKHGTFKDVETMLPYVAEMGFDVLYLPPIHPIGRTFRKGRNNSTTAGPDDPGSPWAIGGPEGGHTAIHPPLGTLDDFHHLVKKAESYGMEIALDIAFQCTPDHPYVRDHPSWFKHRPDGTIQYAENPPKKYQDIYPFHFETEDWRNLWEELKNVFLYWIQQGVKIFRVDNPHTKPFDFWEWTISEIKRDHPEVIFLSEAFTRPKVLYQLAKLGFTQSYNYFPWRTTEWDLSTYLTELTQTEVREYCRANLWPNTPDILTDYLQHGGRPAFMVRLILAATLGASYGIYGPAFELCEHRAVAPGKEEYFNSEKYEIRHWDRNRADSLRELIARINQIRRENVALQSDHSLRFHHVTNDQMLCYSKRSDDPSNLIVTVVNLDPYHKHSGWIDLPIDQLGLESHQPYQAHDLLTDARYLWHGGRNYVELDPQSVPAHVFRVRRRVRSERDFEYFL